MKRVPISVVMPVYNGAKYIKECIDSILFQTFCDFELIIVDDGSTDDTCQIIESYNDKRIILIRNHHNYIESCNLLLSRANGKYIARMDCDDIMLPDRLQIQYEYMEEHRDVCVISGHFADLNTNKIKINGSLIEHNYTLEDLLKANRIVNPASMMRLDDIIKHNLRYEEEYIYAEDYRFWACILMKGLTIRILPQTLIKYRFSDNQTTKRHRKETISSAIKVQNSIARFLSNRYYNCTNKEVLDKGKKLSVLIPFANEGEEVVNTINSIKKHVGNNVDIIVCNDMSTDGFDYSGTLSTYQDVYYFYNPKRKGVAGSRDYCVSLCKTPYFILLDAHMRFYSNHWVKRLVEILENDDRCILCCQTLPLKKEGENVLVREDFKKCYGALLPFKNIDLTGIEWRYEENLKDLIEPIPAILGAGYAASKRYWNYINGLEGLRTYGTDEQFLSLKVWTEGGQCLLVKDITIGHIYRDKFPYINNSVDNFFNKILLSELFFPFSWKCRLKAELFIKYQDVYANACELYNNLKTEIQILKKRQQSIATRSLQDYIHLTRTLCSKKLQEQSIQEKSIHSIAEIVCNEKLSNSGISVGKMGYIIWLSIYSRIYTNTKVKEKIKELWCDIQHAFEQRLLPMNFKNGLLGIGWGLIFLKELGLIEDNLEEFLSEIDKKIGYINIEEMDDYSIDFGLGGIVLYVNARIQSLKSHFGIMPNFGERVFSKLSSKIQESLNDEKRDYNVIYQFLKYQALLSEDDFSDFSISCIDWLELKKFIPKNLIYAEKGLSGNVMSTTLYYMLTNKNFYKNEI